MIFTRAAILLTIAVVSAAPIERRQTTPATASKIVNDMELMSTDLATWQSVINPFTGTVVQELEFEQAVANLQSATLAANADAESAAVFDAADSDRLTIKLDNITPVIVAAVKTLGTKASVVTAAGFNGTVVNSLNELAASLEGFLLTMETLMDSTDIADLKANKVSVDAVFDTVLRLY